jgi:excisionase family DNA binding protein
VRIRGNPQSYFTTMEKVMTDPAIYSINEARLLLGRISRSSIYRLLNEGKLTSVRIGYRRFIRAQAIAEFIEKYSTSETPSESPARLPMQKK